MKVTVCELDNNPEIFKLDWQALANHVRKQSSTLVVLPEMAFHPWVSCNRQTDPETWRSAVASHDSWLLRLSELGAPLVAGTRPVLDGGEPYNEGFVWERSAGYRPVHRKYYLPDEEGFWEARWYRKGPRKFDVITTGWGKIGFLICTELWFTQHAREYARQDVDLIVCPRATPLSSKGKWVAGGRVAAVVGGAYCLSSNFRGTFQGIAFGGAGWVVEPEEGHVLGITDPKDPFLTVEIDLSAARKAKSTYPRYVQD